MPAKKGNKYASFNNLDHMLNKKKETGLGKKLKECEELEQLPNLMSLEY